MSTTTDIFLDSSEGLAVGYQMDFEDMLAFIGKTKEEALNEYEMDFKAPHDSSKMQAPEKVRFAIEGFLQDKESKLRAIMSDCSCRIQLLLPLSSIFTSGLYPRQNFMAAADFALQLSEARQAFLDEIGKLGVNTSNVRLSTFDDSLEPEDTPEPWLIYWTC